MLRKVLLPAAVSLVLAVFAGHGSFTGGIAHAATLVPGSSPVFTGNYCGDITFTPPSSYSLSYCNVGESDGPTGDAPDNDDDSGFQNQVGTTSYSGLDCNAASIINGKIYYSATGWVEYDGYNPVTNTYSIDARCTVQTGDTGVTGNLFAYLYESNCDTQDFGDYPVFGSGTEIHVGGGFRGSSQLFETESPAGVVTLHCDAIFYRYI